METTKELIEAIAGNGLMDYGEEPYFAWWGCDRCNEIEGKVLGATVYDCKGYKSLQEAKENKDNYYSFRVCAECLNVLVNGE